MDIKELCINCFRNTGGEEVCMHCGYIQSDKPKQLCHLYPHTILNERYIIGRVINNGGFGVVYKAYDMKLENIVAIKELLPTQNSMVNRVPNTTDVIPVNEQRAQQFELFKQKFLQEARTMAQFSQCESIVRIYDYFAANNTAYLVMEFLDGVTLREYLDSNQNKQIDFERAMSIILPVMEALKFVHKANVIHRDVSPDNIFLCNDGRVKLIDFGAAKFSETEIENNNSVVMKPGYTPPEQYRTKGKIGPYSDIYSVGAVLYTILSGSIPEESIDRVEKDHLEKLSKLGVSIPIYAEKSIMKAMALREQARFKSMDDFIKAVKGEKKADFPEVELKKKKIKRAVSVTLVFVVMITSVFAVYQVKNRNDLVPSKNTIIKLWYSDNGNEALNERWNIIADEFSDFVAAQSKSLDSTEIVVKGIPAENYEETLKQAFENGTAPDIYESTSSELDGYAASLNNLYDEIDDADYESIYQVMKSEYQPKNKIAVCFDVPVLYTYTDFKYISTPDSNTSLDKLQKADTSKGKFKYSLLCNPDTVLYASYSYGYQDSGVDTIPIQLYNAATVFDGKEYVDPASVFTSSKDNAMYYIGFMSEYSSISQNSRAGQSSFSVSTLTGSNVSETVIFPEVWSISSKSSSVNRQCASLFLYFLIAMDDGQGDITRANRNTYYLPMLTSAVENIGYYEEYKVIYNPDNNFYALPANDVEKITNKVQKISENAKKYDSKLSDVRKILEE